MKPIYPNKLKKGNKVAVVALSRSLAIISPENRKIAKQRFLDLGLEIVFGKHVEESDDFLSSSIDSRIEDLHWAFSDTSIKGVFPVVGGFNSNQLLKYIDWNLIKNNPKVFCGFSDITALNNSIYAKTGLLNYSGPAYSTFAHKLYFESSLEYFKKSIMDDQPFIIEPQSKWSDDEWYLDQDNRHLIDNNGHWIINEGRAEGVSLGANICTFNLLQGTEFFPDLKNSILFLEDDYQSKAVNFDRDLQSLIHQPNFDQVKGILIGRFQKKSEVSKSLLTQIIKTKKELNNIPVIGNLDFGHTDPIITFPIGGEVRMETKNNQSKIEIIKH